MKKITFVSVSVLKKVYLVLHISDDGQVIGRIRAFSSRVKAEKQSDYLNDIAYKECKKCTYIVEEVTLE